MTLYRWKGIACGAFFLAATVAAQTAPKFEVVSIREVPANAPLLMRDPNATSVLPGGQFVDPRTVLSSLITFAYQVPAPSIQLVGLPNWAESQSFAIAAKPAEGFPALPVAENFEQVRLLMRGMLADRFHLQLHTETRQKPVLNLEVAKGGLKIKEVDPPVPPEKEGRVNAALGDTGGRMIGKKCRMGAIASFLTLFLKRTVVDKTGLTGYYDFDVKWTASPSPDGQPPSQSLGATRTALLISTMQDEFGLRLSNGTGPVEFWVVDHVERPTEN